MARTTSRIRRHRGPLAVAAIGVLWMLAGPPVGAPAHAQLLGAHDAEIASAEIGSAEIAPVVIVPVVIVSAAVPVPPRRPSLRGAEPPARPLPQDRWIAMDKAKHVGGSMLWTLSTQYVLVVKADWRSRDALPVSAISTATIGLAKEVYDRYAGPTRHFSSRDLVADALGIGLGVLVILL